MVGAFVTGCGPAAGPPSGPATSPPGSGTAVTLSEHNRPFIRVAPAGQPPTVLGRVLVARATYSDTGVAMVSAPVAGRITAIHVKIGDLVKAGGELARIYSADAAKAEADLGRARQALVLAEREAARAAQLFKQGAGSEADSQRAAEALAEAQIEAARAAAAVKSLGAEGSGSGIYILRSPMAGTVTATTIHLGAAVSTDPGDPAFTVARLSDVWVLADIRPRDRQYLAKGQEVVVRFNAISDRVFKGRLAEIGDVVNTTDQSAQGRIELHDRTNEIRPGMFARVEVTTPARAAATVPRSAVIADRDRFFVYVPVKGDTYERREITLGDERATDVIVMTGLKPGDPVVIRGAILLEAEANQIL